MSLAYASAAQRFEAAREAYAQGKPADAARLLDAILQSDPRSAPALHLMGLCLADLGDLDRAEQAIRASIASDKRRAIVHAGLGRVLQQKGQVAEAEKAYRAGLALERMNLSVVVGLADLLVLSNRTKEAQQLITPLVAATNAAAPVLEIQTEILKRAGKLPEALEMCRRAAAAGSLTAQLDQSVLLRELGRYPEAEAAARDAAVKMRDHPSALTALAYSLQDQNRLDEADQVYRHALTKAPFDPGLHLALARLTWSRTGDPDKAAAPLDSVLRQQATVPLLAIRAKLYTRAGKPKEAYGLLEEAARHIEGDPLLHAAAATAAVHAEELEAAVAHAERADALTGGAEKFRAMLAETYLAAGRPDQAAPITEELRRRAPHEQQYVALQAVGWRLLGDERYRALYDYEAMVRSFTIEPPGGWSSLSAYLADLAAVLKPMQVMNGDPLDQSLRQGVQTEQNLTLSDHPVLKGFFEAVQAPIDAYVAGLGKGDDPLRARIGGGHRVKGAWSVRLEPGGFHVDHLHPDGWLSSAFYVELPKAVDEGREGWIKFGQPGSSTTPALDAEHFVKPEPGRLVLFPSYMWHGTTPFGGDENRLTMAFDVVPGK